MHPRRVLNSISTFPRKKLGQNFLISEHSISFLKKYLQTDDKILEIGPGLGIITKFLKQQNYNVIAIEKDALLVEYLNTTYGSSLSVIHQDFLQISNIELKNIGINSIIGNLPFYISTPIIIKILKELTIVKKFLVGLQKEYAERASLKENNSLGIFLNTFGDTRIVKNISRNSYYPIPKVETSWILWTRNNIEIDTIIFEEFLKGCFWAKRKTLKNNLINNPFYPKYTLWRNTKNFLRNNQCDREIENILERRPDSLDVTLYQKLYFYLYKQISVRQEK